MEAASRYKQALKEARKKSTHRSFSHRSEAKIDSHIGARSVPPSQQHRKEITPGASRQGKQEDNLREEKGLAKEKESFFVYEPAMGDPRAKRTRKGHEKWELFFNTHAQEEAIGLLQAKKDTGQVKFKFMIAREGGEKKEEVTAKKEERHSQN